MKEKLEKSTSLKAFKNTPAPKSFCFKTSVRKRRQNKNPQN